MGNTLLMKEENNMEELENDFLSVENEINEEMIEIEKNPVRKVNEKDLKTDVISQFRRDIEDIPLLTPEEEYAVSLRCLNGDEEARKKLIESNYRLVLWSATRRFSPTLSAEDLLQEGLLGLMRATESYDPTKGFRFSTYALWWVKQYMDRATDNNGTIRIPIHVQEKFRKANGMIAKKSQELQRGLSDDEIVEVYKECGISKDSLIEYNQTNLVGSLNLLVNSGDSDDDTEIGDLYYVDQDPTEGNVMNKLLASSLDSAMDTVLTSKEKYVLERRYYDNLTLEAVGNEMKVTRERVRQIESRAIMKMRRSYKSRRQLKDFAG